MVSNCGHGRDICGDALHSFFTWIASWVSMILTALVLAFPTPNFCSPAFRLTGAPKLWTCVRSDSATLWTVVLQAPQSMGFPREEYWSGLPCPPPGHPPNPGMETRSPTLQADSLLSEPPATKSLQLCSTLYDPIDSSPPGSSIPGILQARILEWEMYFYCLYFYCLTNKYYEVLNIIFTFNFSRIRVF